MEQKIVPSEPQFDRSAFRPSRVLASMVCLVAGIGLATSFIWMPIQYESGFELSWISSLGLGVEMQRVAIVFVSTILGIGLLVASARLLPKVKHPPSDIIR